MATNDLIETLVADLRPVRPRLIERRLALGVGVGMAGSAALMLALIGLRPDLAGAVHTPAYWMKFLYTLLLAAAAAAAASRLARPLGRGTVAFALWVMVLALLGIVATMQFGMAPPAARMRLVMGASARLCPWWIILLSLPVLVGTVWAMRGAAPTRLTLAGAAAGLAAGGFGAWVYAFHCDEVGMPFLALWYTLGIVVVGVIGAVIGRVALRW